MEEDSSPRRGQLHLLTRHFFGRFFDTENIAVPHTEMHILFVQILAVLVVPGYFKIFTSITKYSALAWYPVAARDQAVLLDMHLFLCLSMILTGFITVFEWDALFPDQKDFYNLVPLPVSPRTLFFAKIIALLSFVIAFNIAINGLPIIMFPDIVLCWSGKPGSAGQTLQPFEGLRYMAGQAVSLFGSSLFVFTSLLSFRAVLLLIIPARLVRIVSRLIQLLIILMLLCALFSGIDADRMIKDQNLMIYLFPPFWFLGLFEMMIGHHDPVYASLAEIAYRAVAISASISVLGYITSYRSSMQKGFYSAGTASYPITGMRRIVSWILDKTLLKDSMECAHFHFIAQTVARRQEHMLYWGSFIALGTAVIYLGFYALRSNMIDASHYQNVILSFPLVMSFFILVGLRFAFTVPADLNANWVFKIMGKTRLEMAYRGVHKFMICAAIAPLLIMFVPGYLMIWDPGAVLLHTGYVILLSLLLVEVLLLSFDKLPFTCSYLPGKSNLILLWPAYLLISFLYSYGSTVLEKWILADVWRFLIFLAAACFALAKLNQQRVRALKRSILRFEESPREPLIILSLQ